MMNLKAQIGQANFLTSGKSVALLALAIGLSSACTGTIMSEEVEEEEKLIIAHETRYVVPSDVLAIGNAQNVPYTGAGSWRGTSGCGGSMSEGAIELKGYLAINFPQISQMGGYNCRHIVGNSSKMSVHATGRALDIHIPLVNGHANNASGDVVANWLITHAEEIGVQYIIWDRTQWTASRSAGNKARRYNGSHAHHDHLHIELSLDGGTASTPWFSGAQTPPAMPSCEPIASSGSTLDNDSLCLDLKGPDRYWRSEEGAGHGGDLLWTNAFRSSTPSNWASWELVFEEAGSYELEVFLDDEFSLFDGTQYSIAHAGNTSDVTVDQGQASGWTTVGTYQFSAGANQAISIFDNASSSPDSERKISIDAIRFTRR